MFEENLKKNYYTDIDTFIADATTERLPVCWKEKCVFTDGKRKQYKEYAYNVACAFDTETTSITLPDGQKFGFVWSIQFGFNGLVIVLRTKEQYQELITKLSKKLALSEKKRLFVYIHNAAFDFQFLRSWFEWEDVFCMDTHKIGYATDTNWVTYKCSQLLTNASLESVGKNLIKYPVKKMVGDLDYSLVRHSKSPITETEMGYLVNDIRVVCALIQEKIEEEEYGVLSIPLTSTGYARRHCRNHTIKSNKNLKKYLRGLTMTESQYVKCKKAFAGGFTHCNAHWNGVKIKNVHSEDVTSDYPTISCCEKFPAGNAFYVEKGKFSECNENFCTIFTATFINLKASNEYDHILSSSKCEEVKLGDSDYWVEDNGRIVSARRIKTTMTNVDFESFKKFYTWTKMIIDKHCITCYAKDYLPKEFINCVYDFYEAKTTLKGIKGREADYQRGKAMLNSACYGMIAEDPIHTGYLYENDDYILDEECDAVKVLGKYNKSGNRFIYYPWAIFITAYARKIIFDTILELKEDFIYSDTDSVKFVNYDKHKEYFENYDKKRLAQLEEACECLGIPKERIYPKNNKGEVKPLGVFDYEGKYDYAKFLGAKRYMVQIGDDIEITVAGLGKHSGSKYIASQEDPFDFFADEMYIPEEYTGKLTHTYVDIPHTYYVTDYTGIGAEVYEKTGMHLEPCSFQMCLSESYREYLNFIGGREFE